MRLVDRYRNRHRGWNVKHYYAWHKREGGQRGYTWVKNTLQQAGAVEQAPKRSVHRKRRDRTPWPGMMLHQDGSQHQWVEGQYWALIVTMVIPEPAEGMMPPTSTIRCFSAPKKAHRAAFVVCGQSLSATACFARYIRIEVAMTGTHQKREARWIKPIQRSLVSGDGTTGY